MAPAAAAATSVASCSATTPIGPACCARQVYVTHGNSDGLARYLREEEGIAAEPLAGEFLRERGEGVGEAAPEGEAAAPA